LQQGEFPGECHVRGSVGLVATSTSVMPPQQMLYGTHLEDWGDELMADR
jgi:hypothetical protein